MSNRTTSFWPQRAARLSGLLYLVVIVGGGFAEFGVRERFLVAGDAVATSLLDLAKITLLASLISGTVSSLSSEPMNTPAPDDAARYRKWFPSGRNDGNRAPAVGSPACGFVTATGGEPSVEGTFRTSNYKSAPGSLGR